MGMPGDKGYRSERGFSPRVLTLLTDDFGRHGADVRDISDAFKQRVRKMARDAEEAREQTALAS